MVFKIKPLGCVSLIIGLALLIGGIFLYRDGSKPASTATPAASATSGTAPVTGNPNAVFGTVAADDLLVTQALDATNLEEAKKLYDKEAYFVGVVHKVFKPASGTLQVLNFAEDYKTAIAGAVKAENLGDFPDLETLVGKRVLIQGTVFEFQDRPEVDLVSPDQIKIIR